MQSPEHEAEQLRRIGAGDEDALEEMLQRHQGRLLRYIQRQIPQDLSRVVDPSDLLQETLIEAFRQIGRFRATGPNGAFRWLARIARNNIIDMVRRYRAKKRSAGSLVSADRSSVMELLEQLAVYSRTPSRSAADHEMLAAVQRSILRLPVSYRQVLTLRHIEGRNVQTTAQIMGKTDRAVEHLTSRALHALREDLRSTSTV